MSSDVEIVKLVFCFGGEWMQDNNMWDYVNSTKHGVKLPTNVTYRKLLGYAKKRCEISRSSVGVTKLVYLNDGSIYELTNDGDVSGFMELAAQSNRPLSVIVYVDSSIYDEGVDEGDETQDQSEPDSQFQTSYEYVPETQQVEEEEEDDDDDDDETQLATVVDDKAYVFSVGQSTNDEEEKIDKYDDKEVGTSYPTKKSFCGINDFFDMPPPLPDVETYTKTYQPAPYNRIPRISVGQLFDTKKQMIEELRIKFLEEGFVFKTKRSTKDRFEAICKNENCNWRMTKL